MNGLYSQLQLGSNKNDDMLYLQALLSNQKIAAKLYSDPSSSKQVRLAGRQQQLENQFKIIEFYDFKNKYDKMLAEMETFLAMLTEDGKFKDVEDNLVWLINNQGVAEELKLGFAARIHQIDQFYNPYTKIEKIFAIMLNL